MEEKNEIMTNLGEIITLIGKLKSCDGKNLKTINKKVNNLHSYLKKKKKKTIKRSRKSQFISSNIMSEPEDVPSEPVGMSPGPDDYIPSEPEDIPSEPAPASVGMSPDPDAEGAHHYGSEDNDSYDSHETSLTKTRG